VHVLDRVETGPKPDLVRAIGATYHSNLGSLAPLRNTFDLVFECTGVSKLVLEVVATAGPNSVTCLTGVSSGSRLIEVDVGCLVRELVLENGVVFGSVNANRRHYDLAATALRLADRAWLARLVTRRVPLDRWAEALRPHADDVKTVIVPR
jgi:threonine dehydrogenase-like Zn-dependent dehydrogenase